jgi:aryl-alcohol dehydrogenase-like predicted oxidoreductase
VKYRKFGNAGIEVSRLCLGCMDFPLKMAIDDSRKLLDSALDRGVNFLDTADGYRDSEEILGKILGDKRDKIILATKFWINLEKRVNGGGCSRVHIMQAVEGSLKRLQTDYIDIYQLHHPDENTPVEEVLSTMDTLVKQGKIRYVAVSNHYAWQMAHMLGVSALHNWEPITSLQCRYNILDRAVENETMAFCERFNIATMIYSPLDSGLLSGKYKRGQELPEGARWTSYVRGGRTISDHAWDVLDKLEEIAGKYEIGVNQLAMAWVLSKGWVTSVIMGGYKPEHFDPMYPVLDMKIAREDLAAIDEISTPCRYRPFHNQAVVKGAPLALNRW